MRKSFSIFQAGLLLILQLSMTAQNFPQGFIEKPLRSCRNFKTETLQGIKIASDNVNSLYLPLPDGLVKAVNSKNLETIWQTEVGGEIKGPLIYNGTILLVASIITETNENNVAEKKISVQALSSATGIAQWKQEFPVSGETGKIYILPKQNGDELYILSDKGNLIVLDKESGKIKSAQAINKIINFPILTNDGKIYFGTGENKIAAASKLQSTTETNETAQLSDQPTALFLDKDGNTFAGDKLGTVYKIQANGKIKWKARTGGEITSIREYADKLLVSSSDNYIYSLSKNTGSRIWKKRLEGKMQGDPQIDENFAIASPIGTNTATIFDLKKGKTVNLISVGADAENSFTTNPLIIGKNVIFSTVEGFYSYSSEECADLK